MEIADAHMHVAFAANPEALVEGLQARGMRCLSSSVTPQEYVEHKHLQNTCVSFGVGFHPWWVHGMRNEERHIAEQLTLFDREVAAASFVGEVGLDFANERAQSRKQQTHVFEHCCTLAAKHGKLLSIHTLRSATEALDMLEATGCLERCTCIMHWFHGSNQDLVRARKAGCLFSVNERMLATRQGRAYAKQIPGEQLLFETDLPLHSGDACSAATITTSLERCRQLLG